MATPMSEMWRSLRVVIAGLLVLLAFAIVAAEDTDSENTTGSDQKTSQKEVYSFDFQAELSDQWKMVGGKWERKNGCLTRTDPRSADPTKAIVVISDDPSDVSGDISILAKLRLDSVPEGALIRAGVSICADPETAHGLNLVFDGGRLAFVHDYVVWGPGVVFPYRKGTWYWIKLSKNADQLKGKAWLDGEPEPVGGEREKREKRGQVQLLTFWAGAVW